MSPAEPNTGYIDVLKPDNRAPDPKKRIQFGFNPTDYSVSHGHSMAGRKVAGQDEELPQATSPEATTLSLTLLFDTYESGEDLRRKYVDRVTALLSVSTPPICLIAWGRLSFEGVLQSANVTYTMFDRDGTPVRATVAITARRHKQSVGKDDAGAIAPRQVTVTAGDTLAGVAEAEYGDATAWRLIAAANGITNPRTLPTDIDLTVPRGGR